MIKLNENKLELYLEKMNEDNLEYFLKYFRKEYEQIMILLAISDLKEKSGAKYFNEFEILFKKMDIKEIRTKLYSYISSMQEKINYYYSMFTLEMKNRLLFRTTKEDLQEFINYGKKGRFTRLILIRSIYAICYFLGQIAVLLLFMDMKMHLLVIKIHFFRERTINNYLSNPTVMERFRMVNRNKKNIIFTT